MATIDLQKVENPFKVLDDVLNAINGITADNARNMNDILEEVKEYKELNGRDKKAIFLKLRKDGTAEMLGQQHDIDTLDMWYITFEGILLLKNGGYSQLEQDKINLRKYRDNYDKRAEKHASHLSKGTWVLAFATIGLLVWETRHLLARLFGCQIL